MRHAVLVLLTMLSLGGGTDSVTLRFSEPQLVYYNKSCDAGSTCPNTPGVPHFCWTDPRRGAADEWPGRYLFCNHGGDPTAPTGLNGYDFSSDFGRTWRVLREERNLLGSTLLVDGNGQGLAYQSDGDDSKAVLSRYEWTQPGVLTFALNNDGTGLNISDPAAQPMRFYGVPEPGMVAMDLKIEQSQPKTSGNIAVRLADGSWRKATNIAWRGTPTVISSSNTTAVTVSVAIFSSTDALNWKYVGCAINASDMAPQNLGPKAGCTAAGGLCGSFGPSEFQMTLLGDGKTLVLVARMDGDGDCAQGPYYCEQRHCAPCDSLVLPCQCCHARRTVYNSKCDCFG